MIRRLLILVSTLSLLAGMAFFVQANPRLLTLINEYQIAPIPRVELHSYPYLGGPPMSLTGWTLTTSLGTATILPGHFLDSLHFTVIDPDSVSGTLQMNPLADSIILRDASGNGREKVYWPNWDGLPGPVAGSSSMLYRWTQWWDPCTGQPLPIPTDAAYWYQDATPTFGVFNYAHPTGTLGGYVRRTNGEGIGNATVKARGDSGYTAAKTLTCKTGPNTGGYSMYAVPPGFYQLWVKASGYDSVRLILPVEVRRGQNTRADIYLSPSGVEARPGSRSVLETAFTLEPCVPNPARKETRIAFSLNAPSKIVLAIFNLSGRRLRTLLNEERKPGRQVLDWNGKDDTGKALAPGNYFLRLDVGDRSAVRKITLLK